MVNAPESPDPAAGHAPATFVSAILTAAGESARMGSPKPLLSWHDTTLLEFQVACLLEGGASEVVVVLGHRADDVVSYVKGDRVRHVVNRRYREGRSTSVRSGVEAISPSCQAIMLLAVDQPRTPQIVSRIVQAHVDGDALITAPRHLGRGGHPLVFSASLKHELLRISEQHQGLREVFQRHRDEVLEVPFDDPVVRLDFNTPAEYEEARGRYGA